MTIPNTRIHIIFDSSGSMAPFATDMVNSYNEFIKGQRKVDGKCEISLTTFNHTVSRNVIKSADIHGNVLLEQADKRYIPGGMTALFDAVGMVISDMIATNEKGTKNIIAILTDGDDNYSREYTAQSVKSLITKVEDEMEWDVVFLGANIDVTKYATQMGVKFNKAMAYSQTSDGINGAMTTLCAATTAYRGGNRDFDMQSNS